MNTVKYYIIFILILNGCANSKINKPSYRQLHEEAIVIDTHNDVLINILQGQKLENDLSGKAHSDLARFRQGGVDVQIFSIWSDENYGKGKGFNYANRQIDSLYSITGRNTDKMMIVKTPADLMQAVNEKKLGVMMGLEGGHMIEDNIEDLENLFERGVRYMTLTWNNSTSWATSAKDETANTVGNQKKGLNELGKRIVRRMNELGMIVDVSHVGEQTFWDAIRTSTKPVIASHSNAYALSPVPRNLKDDQIRAIGKNGGVIHLNFYSGFIDSNFNKKMNAFTNRNKRQLDSINSSGLPEFEREQWIAGKYRNELNNLRPPLSLLLDHLDYIVRLVGVDHVGLGSDFDGITSSPQQLDDVSDFPNITRALLERGYSQSDIRKILGENFIRVFRDNHTKKIE